MGHKTFRTTSGKRPGARRQAVGNGMGRRWNHLNQLYISLKKTELNFSIQINLIVFFLIILYIKEIYRACQIMSLDREVRRKNKFLVQ
jgi:hypothetical protein